MTGTKETMELIDGLIALGTEVKALLADGVQLSDLEALIAAYEEKPEFKAKIDAAWQGVKDIQPELADLDFFEMLKLGRKMIEVSKIFKK